MWRPVTLGGVLFLWLGALVFCRLCAQDLVPYLPGRERWFWLEMNACFLVLSLLVMWHPDVPFRKYSKSTWVVIGAFAVIVWVTGLWSPLFASFSGPPWESELNGMPVSSGTPFMDSVWAWDMANPYL